MPKFKPAEIKKKLRGNQCLINVLISGKSSMYSDYFWSEGKPVGIGTGGNYRIITDPYRKRFSLERYESGKFAEVIYDSNLFDFRLLKKQEESAWQREVYEETPTLIRSLVRNMEERVILLEEAHFEKDVCRVCHFFSPHGIKVATQKMYLRTFNDPFDGVVLNDIYDHPIWIKEYEIDPAAGEFTRLIREIWDFSAQRSESSQSRH